MIRRQVQVLAATVLFGAVAALPLRAQVDSGFAVQQPADSSQNAETAGLGGPGQVRPGDTVVVDRVVAVVGNHPILGSQIDEEIFTRQQGGLKLPTDSAGVAALRRDVLNSLIDEEIMVQQAKRDTTIKITDQEVAQGVDQQVRKVRSNFNSELTYRDELRKAGFQTPEEYRRWLTDQQRRAAYQNRLMEKLQQSGKLEPVPPTEKEMRDFFEAQKGQLGTRPATISFRQIVITPQPSISAKAAALRLADSIATELRQGADFATAAKRFSDDSVSAAQGGELGWFRRGRMVPAFERVAFALKPGTVSNPVETIYGFHIIQVERVQPAEIEARHILIAPEITEADRDSAQALATRLRHALEQGASFDSLQHIYNASDVQSNATDVPIDQLPKPYADAIGQADSNTVVGPFPLESPGDRVQYAVAQVTERRAPGDVRFEDVRDKIREQLSQQFAIRRYLDNLRHSTYIDIRLK
ncbi:MAG TPA: peptidylprolyl isomerase [Gemmatimonadales bacterium]|nr:peptidylprolyl isomerase [Gemmatimonadales bacterium]